MIHVPNERTVRVPIISPDSEKVNEKTNGPVLSSDNEEVRVPGNSPDSNKILIPVINADAEKEESSDRTVADAGSHKKSTRETEKPVIVTGNSWFINKDNIDTDMIYHNRHLAITDIKEMGIYAFGNLPGYEDFATKANPGDIIVSGKNFGAGSSRQQAVDCFVTLGIRCIIAESFGAIYERNAINAAFPILVSSEIPGLELQNGDKLKVDFKTGKVINLRNNRQIKTSVFSEVQMEIYQNGGLF
jgi:3-isopropylmalate dehydratase small subunit